MLVSFAVRLSADCRGCSTPIAVNGIVPSVLCYRCGQDNRFDAAFWTGSIGSAAELHEQFGMPVDSSGSEGHRFSYERCAPRCQRCQGQELDLAAVAGVAAGGHAFCPQCGREHRLRAADELVRAAHPRALFVLGETALSPAEQALQQRKTPVLIACMNCGGTLRVDGSTRTVACDHCSQPNYLPDGLWQQLNPVPKGELFFLICEYDPNTAARMLRLPKPQRIEAAAAANVSADDAARFASDEEPAVRKALAKNPHASAAALAVLAGDQETAVREAVAAHPNTPVEVLARLAAEGSRNVIVALARRPLPPEIVDRLANDSDDVHRRLAAEHPNVTVETLHRLTHDSHSSVVGAAARRLDELAAQGVPGAKRGFFARGGFRKLFDD